MAQEVATGPLDAFTSALRIPQHIVVANELPDRFNHTFDVDLGAIAGLDPQVALTFASAYAEAARAEFRSGDYRRFELTGSSTREEIEAFCANPRNTDRVVIQIDKLKILQTVAGGRPLPEQRHLYFYTASLSRELKSGIASFEHVVWREPDKPLLLVILDSNPDLRGSWLSILGSDEPLENPFNGTRSSPSRLTGVRTARDKHVGWDKPWVHQLTPAHFALQGSADRHLKGLLDQQLVKLAVLFTCDRARERPMAEAKPRIRAEFRGESHVASIEIDEGSPLLDVPDAALAAVARAVEWCYDSHPPNDEPAWPGDRLAFMQTRVAQVLESRPEERRFADLAFVMPDLFEGMAWQWKAFIEGKVATYMGEVRLLEDLITETVAGFTEQTRALVKGLSEAMLAAVAVLIGSFIAAAFKSPFNDTLFRIGMIAYAIYVLVFPGVLGTLSNRRSFEALEDEFEVRRASFKTTLYPNKVEEIVGERVAKVRTSYVRWCWLVSAIYIVVAVSSVTVACVVPDEIVRETQETNEGRDETDPPATPKKS